MKIIKTPSVNFEKRTEKPSFIILHAISTPPHQSMDILTKRESGVSAHFYIEPSGLIHELVSPEKKAFHAGISGWQDKTSLNACSIGIEFQCRQTTQHLFAGFTQKQTAAGIDLCRSLMQTYDIPARHVLGHSDIAPDRKEDPGVLFPWQAFEKAGIGMCPGTPIPVTNVTERLKQIGYPVQFGTDACIVAFKRRFMPHARLDAEITTAFLKKLACYSIG